MSIIIHNCWWYDVLKIIANKTSLKSASFFFFFFYVNLLTHRIYMLRLILFACLFVSMFFLFSAT